MQLQGMSDTFQADWYACSAPPPAEADSLFSVRDSDRHRLIRRLLAPYYRKEAVQRYGQLLEPCLEDLRWILDGVAKTENPIDLAPLLNLFAFDAIGRITVSGCLRRIDTANNFRPAMILVAFEAMTFPRSSWVLSE